MRPVTTHGTTTHKPNNPGAARTGGESPGGDLPLRTCVGCGTKKPPRELLRVAAQAGSTPTLDEKGSAPGRGAYVCKNGACVQRARQRRAFERALKLRESVPHAVWDEIRCRLPED